MAVPPRQCIRALGAPWMSWGAAARAPYFPRSWVNVPFDASEGALRHRIAESYAIVRKGLPKVMQASLDRTSG